MKRTSDRNSSFRINLVMAAIVTISMATASYVLLTSLAATAVIELEPGQAGAATDGAETVHDPEASGEKALQFGSAPAPRNNAPAPVRPLQQPAPTDEPEEEVEPAAPPERAPAPSASHNTDEVNPQSLLDELNPRRAQSGAPNLTIDGRLNNSAQIKCDDMAANDYFGHPNPTTGKQGYEYAREALGGASGRVGENLITGEIANVAAIYDTWFTSTPHREAALDGGYQITGYGICGNLQRPTIVQHFYNR